MFVLRSTASHHRHASSMCREIATRMFTASKDAVQQGVFVFVFYCHGQAGRRGLIENVPLNESDDKKFFLFCVLMIKYIHFLS